MTDQIRSLLSRFFSELRWIIIGGALLSIPARDYRTFVREYSDIRATGFSARVRLNATMRLARISRGERSHVLISFFFCEPTRSSVIPSVVGSELITTRLGRDWALNLSLISFGGSYIHYWLLCIVRIFYFLILHNSLFVNLRLIWKLRWNGTPIYFCILMY